MINPFESEITSDISDEELLFSATGGDQNSLEKLIRRHQAWIYNIALRMVLDPYDAEDVTQDVLIKIVSGLPNFKGKSKFSTWAYRITANHVINMKERILEKKELPFTYYWKKRNVSSDLEMPDQKSLPVDLAVLVNEARIGCMLAMLIYLRRDHRLVYILGEIFGANDKMGSEILGIRPGNFRIKLHRARKQVYDFMHRECGLIHEKNSCHCDSKIKLLIGNGKLNSDKLRFTRNYKHEVIQIASERRRQLSNFMERYCQRLFREHPFYTPPDFVESLNKILDSNDLKIICRDQSRD
jgi:RNA polymerase sigma factor (sigma-70 family)